MNSKLSSNADRLARRAKLLAEKKQRKTQLVKEFNYEAGERYSYAITLIVALTISGFLFPAGRADMPQVLPLFSSIIFILAVLRWLGKRKYVHTDYDIKELDIKLEAISSEEQEALKARDGLLSATAAVDNEPDSLLRPATVNEEPAEQLLHQSEEP